MKIITKEERGIVTDSSLIKFVLEESDSQHILNIATPIFGEHVELLSDDSTLIGSGDIKRSRTQIEVIWGSHSCRREIGYDRPENADTANDLVEQIRERIEKWLNMD